MRIPSLLKIKKQVLAACPDLTLALYYGNPEARELDKQHHKFSVWWDDLRNKHCARTKAGEDMSVPCTCATIAKKHKAQVAEWEEIKQRMTKLFNAVRYPVDEKRKLMERQLLVARAAKMRIKEARRMPSKETP